MAVSDALCRPSNRRARKGLAITLVTVFFVFAIVIGWSYYTAYRGRVDVTDAQRLGCERNLLDRADSIASERDSASFRAEAAVARRQAGDFAVADRYDILAKRARDRAQRRTGRLLGARLAVLLTHDKSGEPAFAARAEAHRACSHDYPQPGAWPWSR